MTTEEIREVKALALKLCDTCRDHSIDRVLKALGLLLTGFFVGNPPLADGDHFIEQLRSAIATETESRRLQ